MKRVSSQLILDSYNSVLRNTVIEQNANGYITNIFDLTKQQTETAHTLFYDGIISSNIISINEKLPNSAITNIKAEFNFLDFNANIENFDVESSLPLLIDFGSKSHTDINNILKSNYCLLSNFNAIDIINACTNLPAKLTNSTCNIAIDNKSDLLLWQGINLVSKQIKKDISITLL